MRMSSLGTEHVLQRPPNECNVVDAAVQGRNVGSLVPVDADQDGLIADTDPFVRRWTDCHTSVERRQRTLCSLTPTACGDIHPDMACDRCGFENPADFRFCGACGSRLRSQEELRRAQERKIISALFCDVVDSTRHASNLDPEAVHVLAPYFDRVRSELTRFGGTVEKFIGDAVCGFFGAPRTHGDDPERAVRAALAVVEWIADRNESDVDTELHVRLGVATGEALVALGALSGAGEAMAWGDVTNSAFRIQAGAPVDGVLVDEATYRATRHMIDYAEAEPVQAKGKIEPILVWRARRLGPGEVDLARGSRAVRRTSRRTSAASGEPRSGEP